MKPLGGQRMGPAHSSAGRSIRWMRWSGPSIGLSGGISPSAMWRRPAFSTARHEAVFAALTAMSTACLRGRAPRVRHRRADEARPQPASAQIWFADEVVELDGARWDVDVSGEERELVRVVADDGPLEQTDGAIAQENHEILARFLPARARAEIALDRLRARLVIPPARDLGLAQPRGEEREVVSGEGSECQWDCSRVVLRRHDRSLRVMSASTASCRWVASAASAGSAALPARRDRRIVR